MQVEEVLLSRWKYDAPELAPVKSALERVVKFHRTVREKHAEIANNPNLSSLGRKDAMRAFVADHAHEFVRVRKAVESVQEKIAAQRAKLVPPAPDTADVAAAVLRSEMRTMLRAMKPAERAKFLLASDADPTMLAAVLEAPNVASGIEVDTRQRVFDRVVEATHPGEAARLDTAERAAELLRAAARVTFDTGSAAADFPDTATFSKAVDDAVGNTLALDADIDRQFAGVAEAA
ncbi:MAG: hypothetical protein J0H71_18000 [Rhizobiales bacterium]|nr:hypothetical protein [Hyphomicrobiales bacterium]